MLKDLMRLFLFRHAEAVHDSRYRDHERPLTPSGRADAARVGEKLAALGLPIDLAIASDSRRTIETWELAAPAFASPPPLRRDHRLFEALPTMLLEVLRELPREIGNVVLIGHNPSFEDFSRALAAGGDAQALKRLAKGFPKSGVAMFEIQAEDFAHLAWGNGLLTHFITKSH